MRKFVAYTIILILVFPAHCFSFPNEVSINDSSDIALIAEKIFSKVILLIKNEGIRNEVKLIFEDGEIFDELGFVFEDGEVKGKEIKNLTRLVKEKVETVPSRFNLEDFLIGVGFMIVGIIFIIIGLIFI